MIKGLEKFKKDKNAKKEIVDEILSMIRDDQTSWLKQAITLRDSLNHFKTMAGYNYQASDIGDRWEIIVPQIAGLNVLEYNMRTTYANCLEFIQDFMCLVIGMFLKGFTVGVRTTDSSFGEPLNQYIKFGLGVAATSADGSKPRITDITPYKYAKINGKEKNV